MFNDTDKNNTAIKGHTAIKALLRSLETGLVMIVKYVNTGPLNSD